MDAPWGCKLMHLLASSVLSRALACHSLASLWPFALTPSSEEGVEMSHFLIHSPPVFLVGARLPISFRGFVAGILGKAEYPGSLFQYHHHPHVLLGAWWRVLAASSLAKIFSKS
jgi:hypothetical protein